MYGCVKSELRMSAYNYKKLKAQKKKFNRLMLDSMARKKTSMRLSDRRNFQNKLNLRSDQSKE